MFFSFYIVLILFLWDFALLLCFDRFLFLSACSHALGDFTLYVCFGFASVDGREPVFWASRGFYEVLCLFDFSFS